MRSIHFYPRSPCGERPTTNDGTTKAQDISIHALLAESDTSRLHKILSDWDFYPRSPCGERRPPVREIIQWEGIFLSTLSLRRATPAPVPCGPDAHISIHALLAESDAIYMRSISGNLHFYPRSPCGERPILYYFACPFF